jgi:hypothetical protein
MIVSMRAWLLLVAILASAGCGLGDGTGTLAGTLYVRGCTRSSDYGASGAPVAYDMRPHYFVADPVNAPVNALTSAQQLHPINKVTIRVQNSGVSSDEADLLFINVADDALVTAGIGQSFAVGPTTNVRASLTLNETCPNAEVQSELDGTMTFTSFGGRTTATDGIQFGDRLAASFDFAVVDRRAIGLGGIGAVPTTPATSGHVAGSFDFIVRQGKAAQPY